MAFSYEQHLVSRWDMSTISPPDLGFRGLGNDGVGTGLVAATDIVQGRTSMATEFNGIDELVTVADAASLRFGTAGFSVAGWFYSGMSPTDVVGSILDKYDQANKKGWALYAGPIGTEGNTRRVCFAVNNGDSASVWTQVAPRLGTEIYICSLAVYNGKLYGGTYPNGMLYEWDEAGTQWVQVAPRLGTETNIYTLAVYNGKLYGGTTPNGMLYEWASGANATYDYELSAGWHHVVAVKDVAEVRLYIGGSLVASQVAAAYDTDNSEDLLIGNGFKDFFCGKLDDVRVYGTSLTGLDAADLYARSRRGATGG